VYERERAVAIEAVLRASRLCQAVRSAEVSEETLAKKDRSPVTVADFGAQAVVVDALSRAFPEDRVVGEEDASQLRAGEGAGIRERVVARVREVQPELGEAAILDAIDRGTYEGGGKGRHWCLDPIDGTKGFLRNEQYAVALALIEEGEVVLGVLGCPNLPLDGRDPGSPVGCLFIGVRGEGATVRGLDDPMERSIRVSEVVDAAQAVFCESVESGHSSHDDAAQVAERLGVRAAPIRMDSQAKYAAVARGDAAIYLRLPTRAGYEERIWDHAAGYRVIVEAGGRVTDTRGVPLDFSLGRTLRDNVGVVATNGALHGQVVEAVRRVLGA
jgi:3'(2'), 5'-bisphosphate nucleotidase